MLIGDQDVDLCYGWRIFRKDFEEFIVKLARCLILRVVVESFLRLVAKVQDYRERSGICVWNQSSVLLELALWHLSGWLVLGSCSVMRSLSLVDILEGFD